MYLNVILLLDITRPNGRSLDKAAYSGNLSCLISSTHSHSVNQPKPNNKAWKEWRKSLHSLINRDATLSLKTPLEEWKVPASKYSRRWKWLFWPSTDLLYVRIAVGFLVHRRFHFDFDNNPSDFCKEIPEDAVLTKARMIGST